MSNLGRGIVGGMATIAIVGGHGKIARLLHPLLLSDGHTPLALVRDPAQAERLEATGVRTRFLDIESAGVDAFTDAFDGAEAIVFAAGGGPDGNAARKRTVDLEGSLTSQLAAARLSIARFVQVSAIDVDDPALLDASNDVWRAYVEAKRDADAALRDSGLAWTIIRPGRLTDDAPTGRVALGEEVARADVTRADVAAVLAAVIDDGRSVHRQWNLVSGDTPVAEAVTAATTE